MTEYTTLQASREWWTQRWLELLDSYRFKKRLERGRNYARQGNILSIEFQGAKVIAKVQGSEPEPYTVSLFLESFSNEEWGFIIETMSSRAIIPAKLLAGEMPQNIEEVFTANGLSLFPFTLSDVRSRCTCPDKANPCKHIAAIYYELGDRFSEDPFVLFQLRGCSKRQIINYLRLFRSGMKPEDFIEESLSKEDVGQKDSSQDFEESTKVENTEQIATQVCQVEDTESLLIPSESIKFEPIKIDQYWNYSEPLESSLVVISPTVNETVIDVLGSIPLAKDEEKVANMTSADLVTK